MESENWRSEIKFVSYKINTINLIILLPVCANAFKTFDCKF